MQAGASLVRPFVDMSVLSGMSVLSFRSLPSLLLIISLSFGNWSTDNAVFSLIPYL